MTKEEEYELEAYEKFLRKLAETNSPEIISNGGKHHAVRLYKVLLDNTVKEVKIFCQSGASDVWHDPIFEEAMLRFLRHSGTTLQVLTVGEPALDSKWTDLSNVEAHHILPEHKEIINTHFRNDQCNFSVFDSKRFRYEYNCEKFKAYGSFNNEDRTKEMKALFEEAFEAVRVRKEAERKESEHKYPVPVAEESAATPEKGSGIVNEAS